MNNQRFEHLKNGLLRLKIENQAQDSILYAIRDKAHAEQVLNQIIANLERLNGFLLSFGKDCNLAIKETNNIKTTLQQIIEKGGK